MVRISPHSIKPNDYKKVFAVFYEVVGKGKSEDEFNKILLELLSPAERIMIVKRITIIYLIMKNINYDEICSVLKVSSSTVSKYRIFMDGSEGIVPVLKNIVSIDKIALVFEQLFSDIFAPGVYGINWSLVWDRKKRLQRRKRPGL